jgi:hypothetical protein
MGQPVVLPKFELPGDKPHWAIRAAWITGGLLVVSMVGLGAVIVHHRNLETEAQLAKIEAIAKVKAEAEAKVAAIAATAKAQREAELAAKLAAQSIPATTLPSSGAPSSDTAGDGVKSSQARRSHLSRGAKGGSKMGAGYGKTGGRGKGTAKGGDSKPASNKPDAIDELLRKMK